MAESTTSDFRLQHSSLIDNSIDNIRSSSPNKEIKQENMAYSTISPKMNNHGNNIFELVENTISQAEFDAIINYLDKFTLYECLTKYASYESAQVDEPTCFIQVLYPNKNQLNKPIYAIFYYENPYDRPKPSKILSIDSQTLEVTAKNFFIIDANENEVLDMNNKINSPEKYKAILTQHFKIMSTNYQLVSFLGDLFYINHKKNYK